jgi:hypothetical protein
MDEKLGRFMALIADRVSLPVDDLLAIYEARFGFSPGTRGRLRKAALDELSRLGPFDAASVFSPAAYTNQPDITIPDVERFTWEYREHTSIHPLVAAAYGGTVVVPAPTQALAS